MKIQKNFNCIFVLTYKYFFTAPQKKIRIHIKTKSKQNFGSYVNSWNFLLAQPSVVIEGKINCILVDTVVQ